MLENQTAPPPSGYFSRHQLLVMTLTALLGAAHATIIALILTHRVVPVGSTSESQLGGIYTQVDASYWLSVNALCLAGLVVGAVIQKATPLLAMWVSVLSFASWLVWGGLLMAWSLETKPPVSLVGPSLILAVVLPLSLATAWAWSDREN